MSWWLQGNIAAHCKILPHKYLIISADWPPKVTCIMDLASYASVVSDKHFDNISCHSFLRVPVSLHISPENCLQKLQWSYPDLDLHQSLYSIVEGKGSGHIWGQLARQRRIWPLIFRSDVSGASKQPSPLTNGYNPVQKECLGLH